MAMGIQTKKSKGVYILKNPRKDFIEGERIRENWAALINLQMEGKAKLVRVHKFLALQSPAEKKKNNTLLNRLSPTHVSKAIGLDYILEAEWSSAKVLFSLRPAKSWDIYYKIPSDCSLIEFTKTILNEIYFLFLDPTENPERYFIRKGNDFNWRQSDTKGNKRRLSAVNKFNGKLVNPISNVTWAPIKKSSKNYTGMGVISQEPIHEAMFKILRLEDQ